MRQRREGRRDGQNTWQVREQASSRVGAAEVSYLASLAAGEMVE